MSAPGSKKMLNIYILEILKEYSDSDHKLTQKDIIKKLKDQYGVDCERKAVARNVSALMEHGYDIRNEGGYYLLEEQAFADSELRLLIDSVYFSPHIKEKHARDLIEKLRNLGSPSIGKTLHNISRLPDYHERGVDAFFLTLEVLDEAIGQGKKVSLMVNAYDESMRLRPRREEKYIVNPYQLVAANGRYYLVGNHENHEDVAHIRIDRISDCEVLDAPVKPMREVRGLVNGLDALPRYMAEHVYMRIGQSEWTRFRIRKEDIGEVIDWFGKDVQVEGDEVPGYLVIMVKVNQNAMAHWAMQYMEKAEVLEPEGLRGEIEALLQKGLGKYSDIEK